MWYSIVINTNNYTYLHITMIKISKIIVDEGIFKKKFKHRQYTSLRNDSEQLIITTNLRKADDSNQKICGKITRVLQIMFVI